MHFFPKIILKALRDSNMAPLRNHRASAVGENFKTGDFNNFAIYGKARKNEIGNNVLFRNYCSITVGNDAELILGDSFFMNNYCSINCLDKIEASKSTQI